MDSSKNMEMIIRILSAAKLKSDNEKLASLLLITKFLKSNELSNDEELHLFQSIDLSFIFKLLKTNSLPDGNNTVYYKSIALSILKSFSTLPFEDKFVSGIVLPSLIQNIQNKIIHNINDNTKNIHDLEDINLCAITFINQDEINYLYDNDVKFIDILYEDTLIILRLMLQVESAREIVFKSEILNLLMEIIENIRYDSDQTLTYFFIMISYDYANFDIIFERNFLKMLTNIFSKISIKNPKLLNYMDILIKLFTNITIAEFINRFKSENFWTNFLDFCFVILKSNIDLIYHQKLLIILSSLLQVFSFSWPILHNYKSLVHILLHLASIEMRMILDDCDQNVEQLSQPLILLEGMTSIIIEAIKYFQEIKFGHLLGLNIEVDQLNELISDAIITVVNFITNCHNFDMHMRHTFLNPCFCLLSAYISINEFALDEDIVDLVPILIDACFSNINSELVDKCIKDELKKESIELKRYLNDKSYLVHLLLPGFEHLTHLAEVRQIFLKKNFILVLVDHLKNCTYVEDVNKIFDILYNFTISDELIDYRIVVNFIVENFHAYDSNPNALTLLFAIISTAPENLIQDLDVEILVSSAITILKNINCEKELKEDLIKHMTNCSKFPKIACLISEDDYTNIFIK